MTEKELFANAMKQNMKNPAEQSAGEIRESKTKYGYVRTSGWKYAAAAAALAVAAGVGTVLYLHQSDTAPTASEPAAQAESINTPGVSREYETAMGVYRDFWNEVKAAPENYSSSVQILDQHIYTEPECIRSVWFGEDSCGQPKSGINQSREISEFFAGAEDVEYLGFNLVTADPESRTENILAKETLPDKGIITLVSRADTSENTAVSVNYYMGKSGALLMIPSFVNDGRERGKVERLYYYRVSSPDGKYPCYDGNAFTVPDWYTCTSNQSYITEENNIGGEYRVSDAEERISWSFTPEYITTLPMVSSVVPAVKISGMTLPEGVSITEGEFIISIVNADNIKQDIFDGESNRTVSMTEDIISGGVTVDLNEFTEVLQSLDHVSLRVEAYFNTNEHTAADSGKEQSYAYRTVGYVGVDLR